MITEKMNTRDKLISILINKSEMNVTTMGKYLHKIIDTPNTIQQDIYPNIRLAGNSPAGYSAGTILLPIKPENKALWSK